MAKSNKSKWIIGLSGAALSAFVIAQVGDAGSQTNASTPEKVSTASMSKQEKELVQLDWSNYSINGTAVSGEGVGRVQYSDRKSQRS